MKKVLLALIAGAACVALTGCNTGAGLAADGKVVWDTGKGILTATFEPPEPPPVVATPAPAPPLAVKTYRTLEK